jgi:hypothetical protein
MYKCAAAEGLHWFKSLSDTALLLSPASPLTAKAKEALRVELQNPRNVQTSEATLRVLNAA